MGGGTVRNSSRRAYSVNGWCCMPPLIALLTTILSLGCHVLTPVKFLRRWSWHDGVSVFPPLQDPSVELARVLPLAAAAPSCSKEVRVYPITAVGRPDFWHLSSAKGRGQGTLHCVAT